MALSRMKGLGLLVSRSRVGHCLLVVMALLAVTLSALTGYRYFRAVETVRNIRVEIDAISVESDRVGARLRLILKIDKADSGPVAASRFMYWVSINGQVLGSSQANLGYRTLGSEPIRPTLTLRLEDTALSKIADAEQAGQTMWELAGVLRIGIAGADFWVPVSARKMQNAQ